MNSRISSREIYSYERDDQFLHRNSAVRNDLIAFGNKGLPGAGVYRQEVGG